MTVNLALGFFISSETNSIVLIFEAVWCLRHFMRGLRAAEKNKSSSLACLVALLLRYGKGCIE